jgi:hypothetical protein
MFTAANMGVPWQVELTKLSVKAANHVVTVNGYLFVSSVDNNILVYHLNQNEILRTITRTLTKE